MSTVTSRLAGFRELHRLAWRRDRIIVPASILGLVLLSVGSAQATLALYPDRASAVEGLAGIVSNPAVLAMYGPINAANADALAVFKTVMMGSVLIAILALVVVRRHTRTEEEEGRLELVGAGAVGRWAPLAAAVAVALVAVVVPAVLSSAGLAALGMDPLGSVAFGVSWLTAGLAQIGVTAVAVQLAATTRGAGGLAFGFLGVTYILRAWADASDSDVIASLGWLSPLGWAGRVEPYGEDRLWVLGLGVAVLVVGIGAALAILERRDLGAGVLPGRVGRSRARAILSSPLGLVTRLATGTLVGWVVGLVAGGVVIGSLLGAVGTLVDDPTMRDFLAQLGGSAGTVEAIFLATETKFIAAAVSAGGIALVLRLGASERSGIGESVLATPTPRREWYGAHVLIGVAATSLFMTVAGLTVGIVGPMSSAGAPELGATLGAFLSTLPAIWLLVGTAALLVGWRPRFAPFVWAVLLVGFVIGELGPTLQLPDWVVDLSPFAHLSQLPGGEFAAVAAVVMTALAGAFVAAGAMAYQQRDVA
jgi:ABC-2 type transport system permease protein